MSVNQQYDQANGGVGRIAESSKETAVTNITAYITTSEVTTEELEIIEASEVELGMSTAAEKLEISKVSVTKMDMPMLFEIPYQSEIWIAILGHPVTQQITDWVLRTKEILEAQAWDTMEQRYRPQVPLTYSDNLWREMEAWE